MKYYTDRKGKLVAEMSDGTKFVREDELDLNYPVHYSYFYFVDDKIVTSDVEGTVFDLLNDLKSTNLVTPNSKVYRCSFL